MSNLDNYRSLINTIKDMGINSIAPQDRSVLIDLLKTLSYICEFKVLKECYDRDESIHAYLPFVTTKMDDLKTKIAEIEDMVAETGKISDIKRIKLKAMRISLNRYTEIKKAIETRNFDHYVEFMNNNINNGQQITAICSSVLSSVNVDYTKSFMIDGKEKTTLDIIYDLKNNPELAYELTTYYTKCDALKNDIQARLADDQKYLSYLELVKANEDLVREYIESVSVIGKKEKEDEIVLEERISRHRLQLADLGKNFFSGLKHINEIDSLESEIKKAESELEGIREQKEQFGVLLGKLDDLNLRPIIEQYVSETANLDDSIEQKVVMFVKASMSKGPIDIEQVKAKIQKEIEILNQRKAVDEERIIGERENLSDYAKCLVTDYYNETEEIMNVVNSRVNGNVTPLLAAYALKALIESKSLDSADLIGITQAYDTRGLAALVTSCEALVVNTGINLRDAIKDVVSRNEYDTLEPGAFRIK